MKLPVAIILAGGMGTRLRKAIHNRPKVLASVCGKPFLDYVLTNLARQGVQKVILSVGYLAEQVIEYAGDGSSWGLMVEYCREESPLGTAGALRLASRALDQPFLAMNGDTLYLVDLRRMTEEHQKLRGLGTIALLHRPDGQVRGCVRVSEDGFIRQFHEKPLENAPALVNGGIYLLEPQALADVQEGLPASLEKEVFPALAARGQLAGMVQEAYFVDIGVPESLRSFEEDVLHNRLTFSLVEKGMPADPGRREP